MSPELQEEVARAIYVAKGAHTVFGPWEAQLYQSLKEPFRRQAKALTDPLIARIRREAYEDAARVADEQWRHWHLKMARTELECCEDIAAAIRAKGDEHE